MNFISLVYISLVKGTCVLAFLFLFVRRHSVRYGSDKEFATAKIIILSVDSERKKKTVNFIDLNNEQIVSCSRRVRVEWRAFMAKLPVKFVSI